MRLGCPNRPSGSESAPGHCYHPVGGLVERGDGFVGATEWFLLIVVVILVPLVVAVAVTLWTLEQARLRTKKNRPATARRRTDPIPPPPEDPAGS